MFAKVNIPHELKIKSVPPGITSITVADDLGGTPAKCWRNSGRVAVCRKKFVPLPKEQQDMIIAHEAGHIIFDTNDEFIADDFAIDYCIQQGNSLKQTIYAMTNVLSFPDYHPQLKKQQIVRTNRQYQRLQNYDQTKNRKDMCECTPGIRNEIQKYEQSFLGLDKLFAGRRAKKEAKADLLRDKGDAKVLEAQAKLELAKQGVATGIAGLGMGLGNAGGGAPMRTAAETAPDGEPKPILGMKPTTFYIVLGVTIVAIGVAVWYFTRKK